jgi:hypothetical protein
VRHFLLLLLLCAPAHAGELLFLNPNRGQQMPARIEISTPEGGVCRKTASTGPDLVVGGSYGRGAVLSGDNIINEFGTYQEGASMSDGVPTFGVALRIPLSQENIGSCNEMIEVLDVRTRIQVAEEMFEKGLITQEQLEEVASRAYQIINKF